MMFQNSIFEMTFSSKLAYLFKSCPGFVIQFTVDVNPRYYICMAAVGVARVQIPAASASDLFADKD